MTAHQLAKKLLEGPDLPIVVYDRDEDLVDLTLVDEGEGQVFELVRWGWTPSEKRYIRLA